LRHIFLSIIIHCLFASDKNESLQTEIDELRATLQKVKGHIQFLCIFSIIQK